MAAFTDLPTLLACDPGEALSLGTSWGITADTIGRICDSARQERVAAPGSWEGIAADAAQHRLDSSLNHLTNLGSRTKGVSLATFSYGSALVPVHATARATHFLATQLGCQVSPLGLVNPPFSALGAIPQVAQITSSLSAVLAACVAAANALDLAASTAISALGQGSEPSGEVVPTVASGEKKPQQPGTWIALPHGGKAYVAGNLQEAEKIITLVSGVGSTGIESRDKTRAWAERMATNKIAVVAWHGYAAPPNLLAAVQDTAAKQAAPRLREWQRELRKTNPNAQLHLVGYSYGSVAVGHAAAQLLEADRVSFMGSPGVTAISREELCLPPDATVETLYAPGDMIHAATLLGGALHGPNPALPSFGADNKPSWGGFFVDRFLDLDLWRRGEEDSHSSYLWDPSIEAHLHAETKAGTK